MPFDEEQAINLLGLVAFFSMIVLIIIFPRRRTSLFAGLLGALALFGWLGFAFFEAITSEHALRGEITAVAVGIILGALGIFVVVGTIVCSYAACVRSMRHAGVRPGNLLGLFALVGGLTYLVCWPLLNGLDAVFESSPARNAFLAVGGALVLLCVLFVVYLMTCALNMGSSFGRRYDAIIVLGDELRRDHRLQSALAKRVDKAVRKLRKCPNAVLVMSGAQAPGEDESRARAMAEYALLWEVPPERILLDEISETLDESVVNSVELVRAWRAGEVRMELNEDKRLVYGQVGEEIPAFDAEFDGCDVTYADIPIEEDEEQAPAQAKRAAKADANLPKRIYLVTTNCQLLSALRAAARHGIRCHGVGAPCGPFTFLGRFGVEWFRTLIGRA